MKKFLIPILIVFILTNLSCQNDFQLVKLVDNFSSIQHMPYICEKLDNQWSTGCGDSIFWIAIKQGKKMISYYLERLNDTTLSKAFVPNIGGNFTIGDISLFALEIIIWDIPILNLAEDLENPEPRDGGWGYWNYTRRNYENRLKFKVKVIDWYNDNKEDFIWIKSDLVNVCDCGQLKNPAGGHFEINKK